MKQPVVTPWTASADPGANDLSPGRLVLTVAALCLVLLLLGALALPRRSLGSAAEARSAGTARHMVRSGEYILPRFNDQVRLKKPPLYYWEVALFGQLTGDPEITRPQTAKWPSWLAFVLTLPLVAWWGRVISSRRAGLYAALFLAISGTAYYAQMATLETNLMLFTTLGLFLTYRSAVEGEGTPASRLALGLSLGAAALAKGPIAWFLVGIGGFLWRLRAHRRGWAPVRFYWPGLLEVLLSAGVPVGLWVVALVSAVGEWPRAAAQTAFKETLVRFLVGWDHVRPFWYLVLPLVACLGVAGILVLVSFFEREFWEEKERAGRGAQFLAVAVVSGLAFFSLSASKHSHYVLPLVPAGCVLAGVWFDRRGAGAVSDRLRPLLAGLSALVAASGMGLAVLPAFAWASLPAAVLGGATAVVFSAAGIREILRGRLSRWPGVFCGALLALAFGVVLGVLPRVDDLQSLRPFAQLLARKLPKGVPLAFLTPGEEEACYYLDREVLAGPRLPPNVPPGGLAVVLKRRHFFELVRRDPAWQGVTPLAEQSASRFRRDEDRLVLVSAPAGWKIQYRGPRCPAWAPLNAAAAWLTAALLLWWLVLQKPASRPAVRE